MLLTIYDSSLRKVAYVDNEKQGTLNYYDDTWTRSLETGSSTYEFTVFKKSIESDSATQQAYNYLNERSFVGFRYHGNAYLFSVMTVEQDEWTIKCYCENLNLELTLEQSNAYKATRAMSFVEYCKALGLIGETTFLQIGRNEVSDLRKTLEWEGQETKLARLLSLAKKFDAEIDFSLELNKDSSIKSFVVNVYHEHDDNHQGVGRRRDDILLRYGKNVKSIKRKVDKTGIYNVVRPVGKGKRKNAKGEEEEIPVYIDGLNSWEEFNSKKVREFYQSGKDLFAPISKQLYPSAFTSTTTNDGWIRHDLEVDSDNPTVIRAAGIRNLKKNAYPAITYDIDGWMDVEVGDTVKVVDEGFIPALNLTARVSEQKISFSNPDNNKTTFGNFKELENRLSGGIMGALERLFEQAQPYVLKIATSNGNVFKNGQGESLVTPSVFKAGKPVFGNVTFRWGWKGEESAGVSKNIVASQIENTEVLTITAYLDETVLVSEKLTFININDGSQGPKGDVGPASYVHFAYANSPDGSRDFSTTDSAGRRFIGHYTDDKRDASQDRTKYKWISVVGDVDLSALEEKIDSKADAKLTQEQLNALTELQQIQEAELQAKLSMERFSEWETAYNSFIAKNAEQQAQSQQDLINASQRVDALVQEFGDYRELKKFVDTYMSSSNEGLIIGKNDASATIKVSSDRIAMFSAGKEVMYISQGVIHIDNGIFTASIRVGKFRTEEYKYDYDTNVIKYVG